jgi:hypothetical protein
MEDETIAIDPNMEYIFSFTKAIVWAETITIVEEARQ